MVDLDRSFRHRAEDRAVVDSCIAVWMPIEAFVTPGPRVTKQSPG